MATTTVPVEVNLRCSYENGDLRSSATFSHAAKGIVFDLNEIKKHIDD